MVEVLLYVGGFALLFGLVHWYIEVYTPRKHMREAIREVEAWRGHVPPRPLPAPAPPPMADVMTQGGRVCTEHYRDQEHDCGLRR
jgi:hypothetical protein